MPLQLTSPAGYIQEVNGPGSLFGGLTNAMAATNAVPHAPLEMSILNFLPVTSGNLSDCLEIPVITGYEMPAVGADQVDCCEEPSHTIGEFKMCLQRVKFGALAIKDKKNTLGCEPITQPCQIDPGIFSGDPLSGGVGAGPLSTEGFYPGRTAGVGNKYELALKEFMVGFANHMAPTVWTGTGQDTGDASWCPPAGLDAMIYTGHVDVDTGLACDGADSIVEDFASVCICGPAAPPTAITDLYNLITNTELSLKNRARYFFPGRDVSWIRVMHPDMFFQLTRMWPCAIQNCGCATPTADESLIRFNMQNPQEMADRFYNSGELPVPGAGNVRFLLDATIPLTGDAVNGFVSDIYWIPFAINGEPMTWIDYARWNDIPADVQRVANARLLQNGRWLTYTNNYINGCGGDSVFKIRPRYIMRTPQLAAKITNVCFNPGYEVIDYLDQDGGGEAVRGVECGPSSFE